MQARIGCHRVEVVALRLDREDLRQGSEVRAFEHAPDEDLSAEIRGETWLMQWECGVRVWTC